MWQQHEQQLATVMTTTLNEDSSVLDCVVRDKDGADSKFVANLPTGPNVRAIRLVFEIVPPNRNKNSSLTNDQVCAVCAQDLPINTSASQQECPNTQQKKCAQTIQGLELDTSQIYFQLWQQQEKLATVTTTLSEDCSVLDCVVRDKNGADSNIRVNLPTGPNVRAIRQIIEIVQPDENKNSSQDGVRAECAQDEKVQIDFQNEKTDSQEMDDSISEELLLDRDAFERLGSVACMLGAEEDEAVFELQDRMSSLVSEEAFQRTMVSFEDTLSKYGDEQIVNQLSDYFRDMCDLAINNDEENVAQVIVEANLFIQGIP